MKYRIVIQDLVFDTIIGILDFERVKKQKVIIDLKIEYIKKENYIDYKEVIDFIEDSMNKEKFYLIEDALEFFKDTLKTKFPQIETLFISIKKPSIIDNAVVGVESFIKFS